MAPGYEYEIDADDRIVAVSDAWIAFAESNGAAQLTRDNVLKRSIGQFIAGWELGDLYARLFATVRRRRVPVRVPFRCDAPDLRRFMELDIAPAEGGHLRLCGRVLATERRRRVPLLDPEARRGAGWRVICSVCRQLQQSDGSWLDPERAEASPYEEPATGLPRLSHTVCPPCALVLRSAIGPRAEAGTA